MKSWISSIPNWLPMVTSLFATAISVLAYVRSAPPVLPKAWFVFKGRGRKGATVTLHVENHTAHPIRVVSVKTKDRKIRTGWPATLVPSQAFPSKEPPQFSEIVWGSSLDIGVDVPPNGSLARDVVLEIFDTSVIVSPSMHLCISTMRRTIKKRTMVIPVIVPIAT